MSTAIIACSVIGLFLYLCMASLIGKALKQVAEQYPPAGAAEGAFPADREQ